MEVYRIVSLTAGKYHLGDLIVDGRIMLKFFYNRYRGVIWFHLVTERDYWLASRSMKGTE